MHADLACRGRDVQHLSVTHTLAGLCGAVLGLQMQELHSTSHQKWENRASVVDKCNTCRQPALMQQHTLNS